MNFILKNKIVFGLVIVLCILIIILSRQYKISRQHLNQSHQEEIQILTKKYETEIKAYQSKISSLQQNNIVKTVTIYKPSGERIVTHVVDKTVKSIVENKESTFIKGDMSDIRENTFVADNKEWSKEDKSSVFNKNYILGIGNLQTLSTNISDYSWNAGVKIPLLPSYVYINAPFSDKFYKKVSLNIIFLL